MSIQTTVYVVGSLVMLFESICIILFFDTFFIRRFANQKWIYPFLAGLALAFPTVINVFAFRAESLKYIVVPFCFAVAALIFYKTSVVKALVAGVLGQVILFGIDALVSSFLVAIFHKPFHDIMQTPATYYISMMIAKTLAFLIIIAIRWFWKGRLREESLSSKEWILLAFVPLVTMMTYLAFLSTFFHCGEDDSRFAIWASLGLLFLNVSVTYLIDSIISSRREKTQNIIFKRQIEIEMNSLNALTKAYQGQRQLMHDHKNHIATIDQLARQGNMVELEEYLENLGHTANEVAYSIHTGHVLADAVLNNKQLIAREKGIEFTVAAENLTSLFLQNEDLVASLGNMLDNAIEACERKSDNRAIEVKIALEDRMLVISVRNTVENPVIISGKTIKTSKQDKAAHGIGMQSIAASLAKYGGDYELFCENGWFQITAVVPRPTTAA